LTYERLVAYNANTPRDPLSTALFDGLHHYYESEAQYRAVNGRERR